MKLQNFAERVSFSNKGFFSKREQISCIPRICSHLLREAYIENFIRSSSFKLQQMLALSFVNDRHFLIIGLCI